MRAISHLTGVTIGGAAIVVTVGGFALTPAASHHVAARHHAAAGRQLPTRHPAPRARTSGTAGRAPGRPAVAALVRSSSRIMPGGPMLLAGGVRAGGLAHGGTTSVVQSANWAGYAATKPGQPLRFVQGTFFVPFVNCATAPGGFSAHWVGLDGFDTGTVEQAGVDSDCSTGTPVYSAWFEMFPESAVFPHITIRAGDSITVSVFFRRGTGRFEIRLTDTSNGAHFFRSLACPAGSDCRRQSAEAISEPPVLGTQLQPLADFRAESFTGLRVTDQSGHRGTLRSPRWDTTKIINVSTADEAVLDQPTQLFQGTTFDNYWMRAS